MKQGFFQYLGEDIEGIETFVDLDSVWTDPDHPWVQRVFDLLTPFLGERPAIEALPFFTDAAVLKPAFGDVPTIILGPGETHMAHQTDEFCVVERIPVAVEMYETLIRDWADSKLSDLQRFYKVSGLLISMSSPKRNLHENLPLGDPPPPAKKYETSFLTQEVDICDGEVKLVRTKQSNQIWQVRIWVRGEERSGPRNLGRPLSKIFHGIQAANSRSTCSKYTASGVRRSSALWRRLVL